jgi:hypothetical protein
MQQGSAVIERSVLVGSALGAVYELLVDLDPARDAAEKKEEATRLLVETVNEKSQITWCRNRTR